MSTQTTPDSTFQTDGAILRWRRDGSGPALVLLHGWPLDLDYWEPAVELLATRFTLLRFDRRGFGLSTGTPDVTRNVGDLEALMDAASIERAVLVGMSQGARLAIHFALAHPARVRGLVLDGAPALDVESELPLRRFRQLLARHGSAALQADLLQQPFMKIETADRDARRLLERILARYGGADLQRPVARTAAPDLGAITAPVLILNGALDSAARREAGQRLQSALPSARRVELPNAGHLALLDDPGPYTAAITGFCNSLPA